MKNDSRLNLLINPFTRIAGGKATWIGLAALIVMTALIAISVIQLFPFFDPEVLPKIEEKGVMWVMYTVAPITVSIVIFWMVVFEALLMWAGSAIAGAKARFIDLLGTAALSTAPSLIFSIFLLLLPPVMPLPQGSGIKMAVFILLAILAFTTTIWTYVWMYNGYKVSTGLKGSKLTISFIAAIVVSLSLTRLPAIIQQWEVIKSI